MTRGQLPKPFLRLDPDIDQKHPDNLEGFIRLMCAANRQLPRGVFRARSVLESLFGKTAVHRLYLRGDVHDMSDGRVDVPGWQEWQEGDHTVGDRMARLRSKAVTAPSHDRNDDVSDPSLDRISPPIGIRHKALVPSSIEEGRAGKPRQPSPAQKVKAWLRDHDIAQPVGWESSKVNELAKVNGPDAVIAAFEEARQLGSAVTCRNYIRWAEQSLNPDSAPRNGAAKPVDDAALRFDRAVAATQREQARLRGETA